MYSLPPKLDEEFRNLYRSFRHRVNLAVFAFAILSLVGVLLTHTKEEALNCIFIAWAIFLVCLFQMIRVCGRQSIAAGFICPRCEKALFNGRYTRFARLGECPNCKEFVADELAQKLS